MACQRGGDRQVGQETPVDFTRLQKQNPGRNRMRSIKAVPGMRSYQKNSLIYMRRESKGLFFNTFFVLC
jgi:hypothetical protein